MRGDGSITKRGPDRWRLEVVHPRTAKRHTRTIRAKNRTEAKKNLKDFRDSVFQMGRRGLETITVGEAVEAYWDSVHFRNLKSQRSTKECIKAVLLFIKPNMKLMDLDTLDLQAFQAARLEGTIRGRGPVSTATVRWDLACFGYVIKHAQENGWALRNPVKDMAKVKVVRPDDVIWTTVDEIQEVFELVKDDDFFHVFYTLAWYQTWRQKTITDLRWEMIREVHGRLVAHLPTKTGMRTHPIHRVPEAWMRENWQDEGPVLRRHGQGVSARQCGQKIYHQRSIGMKLPLPHEVRRGSATELYLRGASIESIRKILGHSTEQQTRRYLRAVVAPDQEDIELL